MSEQPPDRCTDCRKAPATTVCKACAARPLCARCFTAHDPALAWANRPEEAR